MLRWMLAIALAVAAPALCAAPAISSFSPSSGLIGATVTINGSGFSATPAANTVAFNTVAANVLTATTTRLTVAVPAAAVTGSLKVTVSGSSATSASTFTVIPAIAGFTPDRGPAAASVTIAGSGFATSVSGNAVKFNGTAATITSATANQIVAAVPASATTGPIRITVGTRNATSATNFTVTASITGLSPTSGTVGTTVRIDGRRFSATPANNVVAFNGVNATVTAATTTRLTVSVPAGATSGPVSVSVDGATATSPSPFSVVPMITSWSAAHSAGGPAGSQFTLVGSGFSPVAASNRVTIGAVVAQVLSAASDQIVARVPDNAVTGTIRVEVAGQAANAAQRFVVYRRLSLNGETLPAQAEAGDPVALAVAVPQGSQVRLGINDLPADGQLIQLESDGVPNVGCGTDPHCAIGPLGPFAGPRDVGFTLTPSQPGALSLRATATTPWTASVAVGDAALNHDYSRPGQFGTYSFSGTAGDRFSLDLGTFATRLGLPLVANLKSNASQWPAATINVTQGTARAVDLPLLASSGEWRVELSTRDGTLQPLSISLRKQTVALTITSTYPRVTLPGDPFTVSVSIAPIAPATEIPTGSIRIEDSAGATCTIMLPAHQCSFASTSLSSNGLRAIYSGDQNHRSASSPQYTQHHLSNTGVEVSFSEVRPEPAQVSVGSNVKVVVRSSSWQPPYGGTITVTDGVTSCSPSSLWNNALGGNTAYGECFLRSAPGIHRIRASYSGDMFNGTHAGGYSDYRLHVVSGGGAAAPLPPGSQVCGFNPDTTFATTGAFVPIGQLPGALPSLGVIESIVGRDPISVSIRWPEPGAQVQGRTVDVTGVYTGPANTGITVNGIVGHTVGGHFMVPNVPIDAGSNTLMATATTLAGNIAHSEILVQQVDGEPAVSIEIADTMDKVTLGPTTRQFVYHTDRLPAGETITSMTIDLDGDGVVDINQPSTLTWGIGATTGLHRTVFQVTTQSGQVYTATQPFLVEDLVIQRSIVCDVYGYLRQRVSANDASGAGLAFDPEVRDKYAGFFTTLGGTLSSASTEFGEIVAGIIGIHVADMTLVRDNTNQTRDGFPIQIARGADGVWRIAAL